MDAWTRSRGLIIIIDSISGCTSEPVAAAAASAAGAELPSLEESRRVSAWFRAIISHNPCVVISRTATITRGVLI